MAVPVKHPKSTTPGSTPNTSVCTNGQLAINLVDFRLFTSNGSVVYDAVQNVATNFRVGQTLTANVVSVGNSTFNSTMSVATATTTGTSAQVIDSFLISAFRTASYTVSVKDNAANNYSATSLMIIFDGSNPQMVEYGTISTNSIMGTWSATANATSVLLNFTPVSANTTVKLNKVLLPV